MDLDIEINEIIPEGNSVHNLIYIYIYMITPWRQRTLNSWVHACTECVYGRLWVHTSVIQNNRTIIV